jgi:hypothetical protein
VTIKRPLALPASCKPPAYECGTDPPRFGKNFPSTL